MKFLNHEMQAIKTGNLPGYRLSLGWLRIFLLYTNEDGWTGRVLVANDSQSGLLQNVLCECFAVDLESAKRDLETKVKIIHDDLGRLVEDVGKGITEDRIDFWIQNHRKELVRDYPDHLVAIHPDKGVVAASVDPEQFYRSFNALDPVLREESLTIDTRMPL